MPRWPSRPSLRSRRLPLPHRPRDRLRRSPHAGPTRPPCVSRKSRIRAPKNFSARPVRHASLATWARRSSSSRKPPATRPKARTSATNSASFTSKWGSTTSRPRITKRSSKWAFPKRENTTISPPESCATASTSPMPCSANSRSAACGFSKIQTTKMANRSFLPSRCKRLPLRKSTSPSSRFRSCFSTATARATSSNSRTTHGSAKSGPPCPSIGSAAKNRCA